MRILKFMWYWLVYSIVVAIVIMLFYWLEISFSTWYKSLSGLGQFIFIVSIISGFIGFVGVIFIKDEL